MKNLICLLSCCLAFQIQAQNLEDFLSYAFASELTRSPSAEKVAWVENKTGARNIWLAALPELEGIQLTQYQKDDGQAINNLIFTQSEKEILYVRGSNANRRGEFPNPALITSGVSQEIRLITLENGIDSLLTTGRSIALAPNRDLLAFVKGGKIWSMDLETGNSPRQLIHTRGNCNNIQWSPDGSKIAFVSNRGDHSFVGIYDLESGALTYLNPSVDRDQAPVWSSNGQQIAYMKVPRQKDWLIFEAHRSGLPWSIWVADVSTFRSRQLWKADEGDGSVFRSISASNQLFWSADDQIVFPWERYGWTNLFSVAVKTSEVHRLTDGPFEVQFVSISPDRKRMLYSSNQDDPDRQHIWQTEIATRKTRQLTFGKGIQWSPVALKQKSLCIASGPTYPASVVAIDGDKLLPVNQSNRDYPATLLTEPEGITFEAEDGLTIHGQLFKPKDYDPNKRYPGLLFFHGGSRRQMLLGFHHRGYYHYAYAQNQYLASQGYLVLSVNYRSGIGYGLAFREAEKYGATGASEVMDVVAAGKYMQARSDVDASRLGLWGGSYGGYLTAWGLIKEPDMFAAGVDIHGAHDWNVIIKNFIPSYEPLERPIFSKLAYESSPMAHIDQWKSPVLLIHGDDDRNVPFSETVDLAEALRKQGVTFEQLIFPDEVHGFLLHRNWLKAYQASTDFFDRKLKLVND